MKLFEMEGFLRGKCLPGDMKVNETNAEYLVRKFTELEQKLAESQREFRTADATSENLQMQVEKLAAENAGLKSIQAWAVADVFKSGAKRFESTKASGFDTDDCLHDAVLVMLSELKTPATASFLAEVRARALPVEIAEIIDSGDLEAILFATEYPEAERYRMALYNFRTSRKGVQS